ncbi:hypothetical protein B0H34DRAFT_706813 [Crassisporium funariophilum]|nr:hypothetical protein B0H34DRAFT_706813 [Crassisporium funariophilum]
MDTDNVKVQEPEEDELEDDDEFLSDTEDANAFSIRDALRPPRAQTFSTQELHSLIHEGAIDLTPAYQRDVVWPESKQVGLIDSIFRNFYIPPVVFAVVRDEDNEEIRVCVDGKQRLTSIQKFMDGQIPHKDATTKKSFWYTTSETARAVKAKAEVPERYKRAFAAKQITCVEYHGLAPGSEREIFQRVQLGMTLTAAEKLQAISSPWAEWISILEAKHVAVDGGLSEVLQWDTKRGRDFQNIAHMIFCCDGLPEELLPTAQKIEKWISRVDEPPYQFKEDIEVVLKAFWMIATDKKYSEGFTKIPQRIAPVEFIFIGVLLYTLRRETLAVQGKAIYILRHTIRQEFKDIRNNTDVGRTLWFHINGLKARPTEWLTPNEAGLPKTKRKRKADVDEAMDGEYRPSPIKALAKPLKTRAKQAKTD